MCSSLDLLPGDGGLTPRTVPWRIILLWLCVVPMLVFGLVDDAVDLAREQPPIPDRLLAPLEPFIHWQAGQVMVAALPAWLDAVTSLLLTASGVGLLLGARRRPEFVPAALIIGLGVLDETDYVPLPDLATTVYWQAYWLVLLAAMVRFASQFPSRLGPGSFESDANPTPTPSRLAGALRTSWRRLRAGTARLLVRPAAPWTVALLTTLAVTSVFDVYGDPLPGRPRWSVLVVGLLLLVVVFGLAIAGVRFFISGYRRAEPARRRRALWLVQACVVYLSGLLLLLAVTFVVTGTDLGSTPRLQIGLAFCYLLLVFLVALFLLAAIYYRGAVNPALVIRKTFLLTMVSAAGFLVYRFVEAYLETIVSDNLADALGWPASTVSGAIGATVLALVLIPFGRRLSRVVEPLARRLARSIAIPVFLVRAGPPLPSRPLDAATRRAIGLQIARLRASARDLAESKPDTRVRPTGDGVLLECPALDAALGVARALAMPDPDEPDDPSSRVRVAIHRTESATYENGEREEAARVLTAVYDSAPPGEVVVSSDALEARPDEPVRPLEECPLMGAGLPPDLRIYRVVGD